MAERLQSYDEGGPLIPMGTVQMWIMHDPLGIGAEQRHDFSLSLWQLWQTESQFVAKAGDVTMKRGSSFNDYYGFGTSRDEAITEASAFHQKVFGSAIETRVMTKIIAKPTLHDAKTPAFYNRTVRCFELPKWRWKTKQGSSVQYTLGAECEFCVWRNGEATDEAAQLQSLIDRVKASDGAAEIRKGASHG
jgi:hypothetical protein